MLCECAWEFLDKGVDGAQLPRKRCVRSGFGVRLWELGGRGGWAVVLLPVVL